MTAAGIAIVCSLNLTRCSRRGNPRYSERNPSTAAALLLSACATGEAIVCSLPCMLLYCGLAVPFSLLLDSVVPRNPANSFSVARILACADERHNDCAHFSLGRWPRLSRRGAASWRRAHARSVRARAPPVIALGGRNESRSWLSGILQDNPLFSACDRTRLRLQLCRQK